MKTIVAIAQWGVWERALKTGEYRQSTIDSALAEVGFIRCSFPEQAVETAKRHFTKRDLGPLVIMLIDVSKVTSPIKIEAPLSGRKGKLPHIYGPLNVDAVYEVLLFKKDADNKFIAPTALEELIENRLD